MSTLIAKEHRIYTDTRSLKAYLLNNIKKNGGWVNAHMHGDRAFTIDYAGFEVYQTQTLIEKWDTLDRIKANMTEEDYYRHFSMGIERMIEQGVTAVGSFIDVDPIAEERAINAALRARLNYEKDITIKLVNQTLKGVIDKEARYWFDKGADKVDIIGGLPRRDLRDHGEGMDAVHMDVLLQTAKSQGKMVHVHVDQFNSKEEKETELVADKTIEHGMEGRVVAIHSISITAHDEAYRQMLYEKMLKAQMMVIACPFAWIDSPRREEQGPTRNAITPADELAKAGVPVAVGTDNIADYMLPFSDGDMWEELKLLITGCRYTNLEEAINIATKNGRMVLGLEPYARV
ncbi:amidohydrolase family protein [Ignatzschineria rhizosphaerae]|uniref:Amidohydrolase family protein n=1 Tax=Ignatzschineria rhizosphaerae TaxID=2923279 RepID=A0ABY3X0Q0_9GAMM|nr:amidohydrolase family protein [Ignatzschineria rhizosphaerae]UNM95027.1 amidohydrolase family protein [Ignatzschineria rhizosphaerae]